MRHTTFTNLDSLSRYSFFQTSPQLFFRSRIGLVIVSLVLLVWGVACSEIPPAPVRFAVIGDYGVESVEAPEVDDIETCGPLSSSKGEAAVSGLVIEYLKPQFIVTTGDNNYMKGLDPPEITQNIDAYYGDFIANDLQTTRFFPALGNHDYADAHHGHPEMAQPYLNHFPYLKDLPNSPGPNSPGNGRYYEVVKEPVRIFVIDSDRNEPDWAPNTECPEDPGLSIQACWLKGRLQVENPTAPWKVVFFHHPPYSSGCYSEDRMGIDEKPAGWGDESTLIGGWTFVEWGATAVVSGHEHFYERLSKTGVSNDKPVSIPYFINGLGGYPKFEFKVIHADSKERYNDEFGAMLVQASLTCINFQFINQSHALIDSYTIPEQIPPGGFNYYVRDWTDSPTSGDNGVVPSTHPQFYTTSDVWNRQSNVSGGFNADNQPQNEDPKNGPAAAGDNFAFARVFRNSCANDPMPDTVTARFLYSELGIGNNLQDAGNPAGATIDFVPDTMTAADPVQARTMDQGHQWNLPTTSSTHLSLAVEISTPSDPGGATLRGRAPGPTDGDVLNDNNKAQRNIGVYPTLMKSGRWSFYAQVHNAGTYKRSMTLRYEVPPEGSKSNVQLEVIHPKKIRPEGSENTLKMLKSGDTIVLKDMLPGENRWIGVTFESVDGKEGKSLPVSFYELRNNKVVNGFTIAPIPAPWSIVSRDILKFHASVFARLAALFGIAKAKEERVEATRLPQRENLTEDDYVALFRNQISAMNDITEELLTSQRAEDLFGIRTELKNFSAAIQDRAIARAVPAHSNLLHKLDAFLTMLQKSKGDPADILQNVVWQSDLFAQRQKTLDCSNRRPSKSSIKRHREAGDVEIESKAFRKAYETRKIGNADYPRLISDLLPCFRETAKEFGGMAHLDEDIANMINSLDSPVALQKAHYGYLLNLQNVVNKP